MSIWFCLFLFARTIFGWSPVYDCKAYLETNTVKNCSHFGFGGYWFFGSGNTFCFTCGSSLSEAVLTKCGEAFCIFSRSSCEARMTEIL